MTWSLEIFGTKFGKALNPLCAFEWGNEQKKYKNDMKQKWWWLQNPTKQDMHKQEMHNAKVFSLGHKWCTIIIIIQN